MAQASDNTVDNGTGAAVRSDINSRLAALYTNHSGTTDTTMVTKYPYQTWADTTANQLKLRNAANNGWIPLRGLTDGAVEADTILPFKIGGTTLMNIGGSLSTENGGKSLLWNTTTIPIGINTASDEGVQITERGKIHIGQSDRVCLVLNRMTTDGTIISFEQAGTQEGTVTVSGSTVSFNGAHLSRWSQLPGNAERIEIMRGTVLTNLNEMCEWGNESNEQLNRMQVSSVEGDVNVAGVFQGWDDDDDTYANDFYCAMTGDFVIRIAQNTVVSRGDLLMSAGDGTAKPQGDDIVRSKTIAKVTSTTVSATYSDGSYCVPCVLMAC